MADYLTTDTELTSIANAIRAKGGTTASLVYPAGFVTAIGNITSGTDVSDTTAAAGDVRSSKYFYTSAGVKTQGTLGDGAYSASVSSHSISTTPVVTGSLSGTITNVGTTTKPSGTDGTDYWTITPGGSVTTTGVSSAKGKATIGTAGYIATGNVESSADTKNITPTVNNGTARYLKKATMTVAGTNAVTPSASISSSSYVTLGTTNNGISVTATGGGTASVTATATTNQAGYAPASTQLGSATLNAPSNTTTATKYITSIGVPSHKSFTISTEASSASDHDTTGFTATNESGRTSSLTNNGTMSSVANNGTISDITNKGTVKVSSYSATAGTLTVTAYNSSGTSEANKSIVSAGKWVATSVSASGTYYGRVSVGAGSVVPAVNSHSVTTTPVVTGSLSGTITNIGTTTEPSGTDGTDYWTITPGGSVTTTGVSTANAKATVTAGYIASSPSSSSDHTVNITPTVSAGTARYLKKATMTVAGTNAVTPSASVSSSSYVTLGTTYNGISVTATGGGTASVTATATTNQAGYAPASTQLGSATLNAPSNTTTATKYITSIGIPSHVNFTISTQASSATEGDTTGFTATNETGRTSSLTNSGTMSSVTNNGTISDITNKGTVKVSSYSATAGKLTVTAYNSSGTSEANKSIVNNGKWVSTSVSASGTYYGRVTVARATPSFTGGGLSGTATASGSGASISDSTNNSGVSISTACTATRANVTYNGAVSGFVNKSSGTVALDGTSTAMTAKTYYVNGVTLTAPSSGTRTFSVTVPNGTSTATFTFNVDASGNVTITES